MKKAQHLSVVSLSQQEIPVITEDTKTRYAWVPVGVIGPDDFFQNVTDAFNTSTTNAACVEGVADLIFGKGLYSKNNTFQPILEKIIPAEELKRATFDLKLYGNSAFQVYWNDDHTRIIKFYHVPVQNLRAEKIYENPRVEAYY
jgi:hypothetical protein